MKCIKEKRNSPICVLMKWSQARRAKMHAELTGDALGCDKENIRHCCRMLRRLVMAVSDPGVTHVLVTPAMDHAMSKASINPAVETEWLFPWKSCQLWLTNRPSSLFDNPVHFSTTISCWKSVTKTIICVTNILLVLPSQPLVKMIFLPASSANSSLLVLVSTCMQANWLIKLDSHYPRRQGDEITFA